MPQGPWTATRTCPLCEATCGLSLSMDGDRVVSVRGDADDVFSRGYVCPKGISLGELHHDPARLRHPLVRRADGTLARATWDDALDRVRTLLGPVRARHGNDAVAVYLGNPNVHNVSSTFYVPALVRALGTKWRFSASTVDQMPKQVSAGLMFGTELSVPVPDVDRTDLLVVLGANPMVSNGSLMTAPDMPGRIRALRARGGTLVVVDPVRTRTAEAADLHLPIRPGTDAFLLASLAHLLVADPDLGAAGPHVDPDDVVRLRAALAPFAPDRTAPVTGIAAVTVADLADRVRSAPSAAVYGRMGTTTGGVVGTDGSLTSFATVASWLVDVANLLSGNLDRPGGAMWPLPAAGGPSTGGTPGRGRGVRVPGSGRTRVRGLASVFGELPSAALAEEIDTPSADGTRVRALVVIGGNPVLSTPDGPRLARALESLDALVCVDAYLTETSRHADVVLPAPSPVARSHYDVVFANLAVRNTARWSPPTLPLQTDGDADERDEADTLLALAAAALDNAVTPDQLDDLVLAEVVRAAVSDEASRAHGLPAEEVVAAVSGRRRVPRILDVMLRSGPYGDGFGRHPGGLSLAVLEESPHGVDLGPLGPRLPEVLRTPSGRVEIAPAVLVDDLARAAAWLDAQGSPGGPGADGALLLVGRRSLRSGNSWLHTLPTLAGGSNRCTLWVHPDDAAALGLRDAGRATVSSSAGSVVADVEVTDAVAPGVVCLPHGWGHQEPGTWGGLLDARAGVNVNALTDPGPLDALSGTAVLSGVPVRLAPAPAA